MRLNILELIECTYNQGFWVQTPGPPGPDLSEQVARALTPSLSEPRGGSHSARPVRSLRELQKVVCWAAFVNFSCLRGSCGWKVV